MSKAIPGDGKIRAEIKAAGENLLKASREYHDLARKDPARTKNNMSAESAEEQQDLLHKVSEEAKKTGSLMAEARDHHKAQTSVLPSNVFGQRRRIKAGVVTVVDPVDPAKMAKAMTDYGWNDMMSAQRAIFMDRATNPKEDFGKMVKEDQRAYLIGDAD